MSKQRTREPTPYVYVRPGPRRVAQRSEVAIVSLTSCDRARWEWWPRLLCCTYGRGGFRSQDAAVDDAIAHGYGAVEVGGVIVATTKKRGTDVRVSIETCS